MRKDCVVVDQTKDRSPLGRKLTTAQQARKQLALKHELFFSELARPTGTKSDEHCSQTLGCKRGSLQVLAGDQTSRLPDPGVCDRGLPALGERMKGTSSRSPASKFRHAVARIGGRDCCPARPSATGRTSCRSPKWLRSCLHVQRHCRHCFDGTKALTTSSEASRKCPQGKTWSMIRHAEESDGHYPVRLLFQQLREGVNRGYWLLVCFSSNRSDHH